MNAQYIQSVANRRGSVSSVGIPASNKKGRFPYAFIQLMHELEVPNPITNLTDLVEKLDLRGSWNLCKSYVGQIQGLPSTQGIIVAKGYLHCVILRGDGSFFIGHKGNFKIDGL